MYILLCSMIKLLKLYVIFTTVSLIILYYTLFANIILMHSGFTMRALMRYFAYYFHNELQFRRDNKVHVK